MRETVRNIKISDIPEVIRQSQLLDDVSVDFTIQDHTETEVRESLMDVVNEIRAYAKSQGLT